jgi:hypothetical protein
VTVMPRTRRGIIRLWFVLAAIWSIGWLVFVAWREVVDHISPIATDFFLLPLIILAPWFITALVLVGRWVAVGFKSHNMDTGSDRHAILFIQHACQYYAAARFAMHAQCTPVCGILFHHTVEMLLKGGLAQKRTLSELEDMRHRLKLIWRAFKTDFPEPFLKRHDGTISSLAKFDAIRYWGCRRDLCWNLIGAISDSIRIRGQAARSIGLSASFWVRLCHPSTLRIVI